MMYALLCIFHDKEKFLRSIIKGCNVNKCVNTKLSRKYMIKLKTKMCSFSNTKTCLVSKLNY